MDFLFPPLISLHFLAFPLCSPVIPAKTLFFQRFRKEDVQKHRVFPDVSLHFLAFPLGSPVFPTKTTVFPASSQRGHPTTQSFSRFSAKASRKPKPAKSRQGESSLGPLFCDTGSPKTTFSGRSSNHRAVRGEPHPPLYPTYQTLGGGGVKGGVILYPLLGVLSDTPSNVGGFVHTLCMRIYIDIYIYIYITKIFIIFFIAQKGRPRSYIQFLHNSCCILLCPFPNEAGPHLNPANPTGSVSFALAQR